MKVNSADGYEVFFSAGASPASGHDQARRGGQSCCGQTRPQTGAGQSSPASWVALAARRPPSGGPLGIKTHLRRVCVYQGVYFLGGGGGSKSCTCVFISSWVMLYRRCPAGGARIRSVVKLPLFNVWKFHGCFYRRIAN